MIQDIHSILTRYFTGEASPEEAELVQAWIAAAPANKAYFDQKWKLMELTTDTPFTPVADLPAEWDSMTRTLPPRQIRPGSGPGFSWGIWLFAILTIVALVVVLMKMFSGKKEEKLTWLHAGSQTLTDTLKNGTILLLDTNSTVSYPVDGKMENKIRISGAVFIKNDGGNSITIQAGAAEILIEKGDIFLQYDSAHKAVWVQVQKGAASVMTASGMQAVQAGETVKIEGNELLFSRVQKISVNRFGYATRIFEFDDTPLKEVVVQLERAYGVRISLEDSALENYRISTLLENVSLEDALKIITFTLELTYRYSADQQVILSRKEREE